MDKLDIVPLSFTCRRAIVQNLLCIINDRLVYVELVTVSSNHLCRIVIYLSLRRVIFDALHDFPTSSHMGEYKTLYRIKIRFLASHAKGYQSLSKRVSALYTNLCMAKPRSEGKVLMACQFTICYSTCRSFDARSFQRQEW